MGNKKELECRSILLALSQTSAEVNSHTKLFTRLCVLILLYLLARVKGNGKLLSVIKSVKWQGTSGKTLFLPKQITGKEKQHKHISQMIHIYTK